MHDHDFVNHHRRAVIVAGGMLILGAALSPLRDSRGWTGGLPLRWEYL